MKKKLLKLALYVAMAVSLFAVLSIAAFAATESVSYLGADGTVQPAQSATVVDDSTVTWNAGWYVVKDSVTINGTVRVSGDVNLILADGCNFYINQGITISDNASLTIYKSTGTNAGKLTVEKRDDNDSAVSGEGTLTVNGGTVTVTGLNNYSGISCGTLAVNGGTLTATGNGTSNGISCSGTMTVNGGTVNATGGNDGGSGSGISCGTLTVNGGTVTANGGNDGGSGISCGEKCTVTVNGGTVTATGGNNGGSGIYCDDEGGTLTIADGLMVEQGVSADDCSSVEDEALSASSLTGKYVRISNNQTLDLEFVTGETYSLSSVGAKKIAVTFEGEETPHTTQKNVATLFGTVWDELIAAGDSFSGACTIRLNVTGVPTNVTFKEASLVD